MVSFARRLWPDELNGVLSRERGLKTLLAERAAVPCSHVSDFLRGRRRREYRIDEEAQKLALEVADRLGLTWEDITQLPQRRPMIRRSGQGCDEIRWRWVTNCVGMMSTARKAS